MLSNCLVSGSKVTTEVEMEIMLGSSSGFSKIILLREEWVSKFTRSGGSERNGHGLGIVRKGELMPPEFV